MQNITNIQPAGSTDVRKLNKRARLSLALAGGGVVGALMLGSLFGSHGTASAASAHAVKASAAVASHAVQSTSVAHSSALQASPAAAHVANDTYWDIAVQAANYYGINSNLFTRQINQESGFNPNAYSPAGAEGIAQFMPATAAAMGVNPWDPTSSLWGGARLMSQLNSQFGGNYAQALAAYNAGPGAVQYAINAGGSNWYSYLPAETQNYVTVIMGW